MDEDSDLMREAIRRLPYKLTDWFKKPSRQARAWRKPIDEGYIYLAQYGQFYKIGFATDLKKRLSGLNNIPDQEIILVHNFRTFNVRSAEKKLHRLFRRFHIKREWFELDRDAVNDFLAIKDYMLDD